jgi:hypothetical protein
MANRYQGTPTEAFLPHDRGEYETIEAIFSRGRRVFLHCLRFRINLKKWQKFPKKRGLFRPNDNNVLLFPHRSEGKVWLEDLRRAQVGP